LKQFGLVYPDLSPVCNAVLGDKNHQHTKTQKR
jgi:hypothetical protein